MERLPPIPDVLPPAGNDLVLLLVGINPGVTSARTGRHFAGPSNRFWPALHAAGITPQRWGPADQERLAELGVGITNLVARPSARADQVTAGELRAGRARLTGLVERWEPRVVAVLGVGAFRMAFRRPGATTGRQPDGLAGAQLWVLPNPSGLNAHARPADHAAGLRQVAAAAGLGSPHAR
jgi:double-stranded uracil-DNA glycosylase